MRRESKEIWLSLAQERGKGKKIRKGKIDREGQALIIPDIEVNTFWSNVKENAETIIELYHDHGTMEQFHGELKTDMDLEKFPSGKYEVNRAGDYQLFG